MRKGFGHLTFALLEQTTVKQNSFQFLYYLNSIFDEFLFMFFEPIYLVNYSLRY